MKNHKGHVGIVGVGPVGLATADRISRRGYRVTLISPGRDLDNPQAVGRCRATHHAAAAFWTPFCSGVTPDRERDLSRLSLEFYEMFRGEGELGISAGVRFRKIEQHFVENRMLQYPKWEEHRKLKFKRDPSDFSTFDIRGIPKLVEAHGDNLEVRTRREFSYTAPVIQVDRFIPWYRELILSNPEVALLEVSFPLVGPYSRHSDIDQHLPKWKSLLEQLELDCLIACTGAGTVFGGITSADYPNNGTFFPMKGVVAHIPGKPAKTAPVLLFEGGFFDREALYWVPLVDRFVLGGTIHPVGHSFDNAAWTPNEEEQNGILERALCFLPNPIKKIISKAMLIQDGQDGCIEWRAGVRPVMSDHGPVTKYSSELTKFFANDGASRTTKFYLNYGHGGSGFTFFHDTAEKIAELVENAGDHSTHG